MLYNEYFLGLKCADKHTHLCTALLFTQSPCFSFIHCLLAEAEVSPAQHRNAGGHVKSPKILKFYVLFSVTELVLVVLSKLQNRN